VRIRPRIGLGGYSYFIAKLNASGNALVYSTFFNGPSTISSIALDSSNNVYLTGNAGLIATTAGVVQPTQPSTTNTSPFVAKLNSGGSAMAYVTYVGGSGTDEARAVAVDTNGNAYIVGSARSADFPTVNAYQDALRGTQDAFVTKLNPTGTALIYSTYLGGSASDSAYGIAVNATGQAFVVGKAGSNDYPITSCVFQPSKGYGGTEVTNGFITKLSDNGATLVYSSFLGGSWCDICRSAYYDNDAALAVAVDGAGYAYVGGAAVSPAFRVVDPLKPTVLTSWDNASVPFLVKVTPLGTQLVYSVLIGDYGTYRRNVYGVATDSNGSAYLVGDISYDYSYMHPLTAAPLLTAAPTSTDNSFIIKLSTGKYPTTLDSSSTFTSSDEPIAFTATVLSAKAGGTVTFMDGETALAVVPVTDGVATLRTTLPVGVHKITAVYSGDGKASPPIFQQVNSPY
jgi:hypothetical protein